MPNPSAIARTVALAGAVMLTLGGCAWVSRASVSATGDPADSTAPNFSPPAISADGRYVAFDTFAGNLVSGDEDGGVFVRDTRAATTSAGSVRTDGTMDDTADTPALSGDGRYLAFLSDDPDVVPGGHGKSEQVFVRDQATGVTTRVSSKPNGNEASDDSDHPSLSGDGRYIAFESDSPGLVPGDTNDWTDVFVRDRVTNTTKRVSLTSSGAEADIGGESPSISSDGRYVAFTSLDSLVPQDQNGLTDVYVRDVVANTTALVSLATDGRRGNGLSGSPAISGDGRFVAFTSLADNLDGITDTNHAPDVFVRDLVSGTTERVSVNLAGGLAHGTAAGPTISADGHFVSYESDASDAVADDTNGVPDAFVYDRLLAKTSRVSTDQLGAQLPEGGTDPVLSGDGRSVTFASTATITGLGKSQVGQLYVRLTVPGAMPR
ncbi:MAG: TolB family protein [Acidimicrobiia bacterium]